jgi:hypothetical protein
MTKEKIIYLRLLKNGLLRPFDSIQSCVHNLIGIQSQFQQFGEISIFNRMSSPPDMDTLNKLYSSHEIVKIWGQRTTVHMYSIDDWENMADIFFGSIPVINKYRSENPEEFDFLLSLLDKEGKKRKILSKKDILKIVEENSSNSDEDKSGLMYTLIIQSALKRILFGYPERPHTKNFVHYDHINKKEWNFDIEKQSKTLKNIMLRYFTYYSPATLQDFCHWSGLKKSFAEKHFDEIKSSLEELAFNKRKYYIPKNDKDFLSLKNNDEFNNNNEVFLLGKFDPLFVCYKHKDWIASPSQEKEIWRGSAIVEAVLIIGNRLSGTWRYETKGKNINFNIFLFEKIKAAEKKKIIQKAENLALFQKKNIGEVNFSSY